MAAPTQNRALSLRDPQGKLCEIDQRLIRFVRSEHAAGAESRALRGLIEAGEFISATRLGTGEFGEITQRAVAEGLLGNESYRFALEHPRIPFISYPYEWPPEMLHAAAELTLRIARTLLPEGLGLKDATPHNILFSGPRPCFVDWLSVEKRQPGDPIWLALGQFCRTFLHPLLLAKIAGLPAAQSLLLYRDGLSLTETHARLSRWARWRPLCFTLITLPRWLERRTPGAARQGAQHRLDPERAALTLEWTLASVQRRLKRLAPNTERRSAWTDYTTAARSYRTEQSDFKASWFDRCLAAQRPRQVLDIGCNTGAFSEKAARAGARVVALDNDEAVVGRLWKKAKAESLDILPLVVDISRPTPAVGWRNEEGQSFLDRSRGKFDLVLMLALIHHLRWSGGVPLAQILAFAAELTTHQLAIEFIGPSDPLFTLLAAGRQDESWTVQEFERLATRRFRIVDKQAVPDSDRTLYRLEKTR